MRVSIIVVNWNTAELTCECLRSVYEETKGLDFEVIVVDNASSDDSVSRIQREFPLAKLIQNTSNKGFAAANNQGMAVALGRYFLLLNSDTVVLDGAISKAVAFADQHPEAAVVGCRVLNSDGTLQRSCFAFPSVVGVILRAAYLYKIFSASRFFGRDQMTWWGYDEVREVDAVGGCFMLVRREAVEKCGVLDERFFMYTEEIDWCYRFQRAGWKTVFSPEMQIIHHGGKSSELAERSMSLQSTRSLLLFMKKHKGFLTYLTTCFFVGVNFLFRIPYWVIVALVSADKRKKAISKVKTYSLGVFNAWTGGEVISRR